VKNQCFNPYLPSWEYIPDGEPHVFDDRVYVYGSHDSAGGWVFCLNDYVCWSAPVTDLSDWRYEGVIYKKTSDPLNTDGRMVLYAPDVTKGPDGRYYLYYVLDKAQVVSVAVSNAPAGRYQFYGYVCYPDGTRLGERDSGQPQGGQPQSDEPQFDPGVLTEGDLTYLYTGFSGHGDATRKGAAVTVLEPDMLTIKEAPQIVVPGNCYGKGTSFEGHEFFEASSIRKHGDTYYFIYSSTLMNELCYATSKLPTKDFTYGGVIVSNCDLNIDSYKPAEKTVYPAGNNHGSIALINGEWYIFYHRMTNGTWFSRQGCVERIKLRPNGHITQVEMTSQGASAEALDGRGEYPAYIACNLFGDFVSDAVFGAAPSSAPMITQYGADGDTEAGYIANIIDSTVIGFKYFKCSGIKKVAVRTRGYCKGVFEVRTALDGESLGGIPVQSANIWTDYASDITIPDGVWALYFTYKGTGAPQMVSIKL